MISRLRQSLSKGDPIVWYVRDGSHQRNSAVGGHGNSGVALEGILAPPKSGDGLVLSIEIDTTPSVERNISECAGLVPAPREHWQGHGNWDVNSDLSHVDLSLEFPSSSARLSEDGGSVTILVLIDDLEGFV